MTSINLFVIDIIKIITYIFGLIIVMGNVFNVNIMFLATGLGIGGNKGYGF